MNSDESLTEQQLVAMLAAHDVKATAMRLLVLRALLATPGTVTLRDLEDSLYPADRSTIFRTLTLFQQHHLLHVVDDGSGSSRYEACTSSDHAAHDDRHIHFHCQRCGRTFCLTDIQQPVVTLPAGYRQETVNCVVSGLCPACSRR